MPVAPKSPRASRKAASANSMKTKGAVRAKSGCYTCRIRRKKCDEKRMHENGPCETCFRLKLECLGFGAKRPDWLRESHKVSVIRDRIKNHLASQGMIKGHSGSGSRNAVHLDTLKLSVFQDAEVSHQSGSASSSSGSPARDMSVESDHQPFSGPSNINTTLRPAFGYDYTYPPHIGMIAPHTVHQSSYGGHFLDFDPVESSGCVSPTSDVHPPLDPDMYEYQSMSPRTSQMMSAKSIFDKWNRAGALTGLLTLEDEAAYTDWDIDPAMRRLFEPEPILPSYSIKNFVSEYVANVVRIQYLLGDGVVLPRMIANAIASHGPSHEAVELLATTYQRRQSDRNQLVLNDQNVLERVHKLQQALKEKESSFFSPDDAMTALHIVSLYLFDGGQGPWNEVLFLAAQYVKNILDSPQYMSSPSFAFASSNPKDQFIIKTAIWFDVLASITTQHRPLLLSYIEALFDPHRSHIEDFGGPQCDMMSPMGCSNNVLWAMAKVCELACWKKLHIARGDLGIKDLVIRASDIDAYLGTAYPQPQPPPLDPMEAARTHSAELFRTATRLFLQTVVNGDMPHVSEVQRSVEELMTAINAVSLSDFNSSAVIRSTVFPIFICGAFTTKGEHQHRLRLILEQGPGNDGVGNCTTILGILEGIWRDTTRKKNDPVKWRTKLKESKILLV